ncbi:hypothetical protein ACFQZ8_28845, partial [Micromonospora azadirachtae]
RDAPLDGAQWWLVGTVEHSVLGRRWVYDACGDPVYGAALASAVLTGAGQAEEYFEVDGRREVRAPSMAIAADSPRLVAVPPIGSIDKIEDGELTRIVCGSVELTVLRRLGEHSDLPGSRLTGSWQGQDSRLPLAYVSLR